MTRLVRHALPYLPARWVGPVMLWLGRTRGLAAAEEALLHLIDRTGSESPRVHAALGAMVVLIREGVPS